MNGSEQTVLELKTSLRYRRIHSIWENSCLVQPRLQHHNCLRMLGAKFTTESVSLVPNICICDGHVSAMGGVCLCVMKLAFVLLAARICICHRSQLLQSHPPVTGVLKWEILQVERAPGSAPEGAPGDRGAPEGAPKNAQGDWGCSRECSQECSSC